MAQVRGPTIRPCAPRASLCSLGPTMARCPAIRPGPRPRDPALRLRPLPSQRWPRPGAQRSAQARGPATRSCAPPAPPSLVTKVARCPAIRPGPDLLLPPPYRWPRPPPAHTKTRHIRLSSSNVASFAALHTVGLVVEYSPATGETRVRFSDGVVEYFFFVLPLYSGAAGSYVTRDQTRGNGQIACLCMGHTVS